MIAVTHPGKIGDFGFCLPICSWLYKTYSEKIVFVFPHGFPFMDKAESLIRLQPFTEDIVYCDFQVIHYDMSGQPYHFNPSDFIKDREFSKFYNFGFRSAPDKFITEFLAEEYDLGYDEDFVLDLGLGFNTDPGNIMCSEVMVNFLSGFEVPDFDKDFLSNLQDLVHAKERHLHFSSLAVFLSLARVPFHLYLINKFQPFVDQIEYNGHVHIDPKQYNTFFKNAPVLDVRIIDKNDKIKSIYNEIFLK